MITGGARAKSVRMMMSLVAAVVRSAVDRDVRVVHALDGVNILYFA
jgi:hypothetical protein